MNLKKNRWTLPAIALGMSALMLVITHFMQSAQPTTNLTAATPSSAQLPTQ